MAAGTRLGCTGWGYDDWKGNFYPRGAEPSEYLARYARAFRFTEIDSSYYGVPAIASVERWAKNTPDDFLFAAKLPRAITHEARLRDTERALDAALDAFAPLRRAGKLGPLVAQCPASLTRAKDADALASFLRDWPAGWPLAVELRHRSWWTDETYDALRAAGAALVWSYTQYGRAPPVATAPFLYLRLVGDRELTKFDRVQRDHAPEMEYWRARLAESDVEDRYLVVNNHLMGHAPTTALQLARIMGLPEPDLAAAARDSGQRSLTGWSA